MNGIAENVFLATSPTDTAVELYVLHHDLEICSIAREDIPSCTHALIKLCLLPDSNPRFFSFTETDDEITLILPTKDVNSFPDCLNSSGKLWKAFTVSTGAIGAIASELSGVSKIARAVISPLADCGISVFCVSTYQSDYILVQDGDLQLAIECLGKLFKIFDENHEKLNGPKRGHVIPVGASESKCRALTKPLHYPTVDYHVTGIESSNMPLITQTLLELMFFSDKKEQSPKDCSEHKFFHFSIIDGDISFVLNEEALAKFPSNTVYHSVNQERWRIVRVGDAPLGFEESGIVAKIAEPIANAQISIYYISTFNFDHALVPEDEIGNISQMLQKRVNCFGVHCCKDDYDHEIEK